MDRKSEEGAHGEPWAVHEWAVGGCVFTERAGDRGVPAKLPGVERLADCLQEPAATGSTPPATPWGEPAALHAPFAPQHPGRRLPSPAPSLSPARLPSTSRGKFTRPFGRQRTGRRRKAGKLSRSHGYTPSVCPVQGAEPESSSRRVECQELGQLAWSCPLGVQRGRESLLSSGPAVGHAPSVSMHPPFVS